MLSLIIKQSKISRIEGNCTSCLPRSFIAQITELIRTKPDKNDTGATLDRHFPTLMWVVRDFALDKQIDGRNLTDDEYLEESLQPMQGFREEIRRSNEIKHTVKALFKVKFL